MRPGRGPAQGQRLRPNPDAYAGALPATDTRANPWLDPDASPLAHAGGDAVADPWRNPDSDAATEPHADADAATEPHADAGRHAGVISDANHAAEPDSRIDRLAHARHRPDPGRAVTSSRPRP
jgi:hypothetical protein